MSIEVVSFRKSGPTKLCKTRSPDLSFHSELGPPIRQGLGQSSFLRQIRTLKIRLINCELQTKLDLKILGTMSVFFKI